VERDLKLWKALMEELELERMSMQSFTMFWEDRGGDRTGESCKK
jgi:hypothetical protein